MFGALFYSRETVLFYGNKIVKKKVQYLNQYLYFLGFLATYYIQCTYRINIHS